LFTSTYFPYETWLIYNTVRIDCGERHWEKRRNRQSRLLEKTTQSFTPYSKLWRIRKKKTISQHLCLTVWNFANSPITTFFSPSPSLSSLTLATISQLHISTLFSAFILPYVS